MKIICNLLFVLLCLSAFAGEVIPPVPSHYFNDYANVVSPAKADQLDKRLAQFERDTSCQVVVAIYTNMQSDGPIKDYTTRVMNAWKVGQAGKNNGVGLFLFANDRKIYLNVGTGLEKALPNDLCKSIVDSKIVPHLKNGDFDGGVTAGVDAILDASKESYKGTGETASEKNNKTDLTGQSTNSAVAP